MSFDPLDRTLTLVYGTDDLDPFSLDGVLRARLSCGHAIASDSLKESCRHQLEEGDYKFKCSAVVEGTRLCNTPLSYKEVRRLADLSTEEMQYFEEKIAHLAAAEYSDIQTCPKCKTNVERNDLTDLCVSCPICSADLDQEYLFCWQCLKQWKGPAPRSDRCENNGCTNYELELLRTCKRTNLPQVRGADGVPSIRACPTCGQRVEHDKTGCKNVICPRCQIEFCFVCLKLTSECQMTSSYFIPCSDGVAPRQTSIPVWRRN